MKNKKYLVYILMVMLFIIVFLANNVKAEMLVSDAGVEYDSEILTQLKNTSEVRVIVDINSKNDSVIDSTLSDLSTSEFRLIGKLIDSSGFYGNINEEGLNKLVNNPAIKTIYLDRIAHTVTDKNESLNETEQIDEKIEIKESNLLVIIIPIFIIFWVILYFILRKIFHKKKR